MDSGERPALRLHGETHVFLHFCPKKVKISRSKQNVSCTVHRSYHDPYALQHLVLSGAWMI